VGELVVITGPPGAGKSSVSEILAHQRRPSALVTGDSFFAMIKQGYILPWLPEARHQNSVIIEAAAAAAGRLSEIGFVVYDGVLGPWFFAHLCTSGGVGPAALRDLATTTAVCLERVRTRSDHAFADLPATRRMYEQFATADIETRHLITEPRTDPAQLVELITRRLGRDEFRYSPA
jgi:cytidylate kinase